MAKCPNGKIIKSLYLKITYVWVDNANFFTQNSNQLQQKSYIVFGPRPSLNHPAASKSDESSGRTMLQSSLPAGQSLLKLKIPVSDKSELVFCSPDSRRGQKRKIAEDASSSEADHLFREAAAKTTEKVPDQLFE